MVRIDWYLRMVLTVIAACLVWLCFASSPAVAAVEAQGGQRQTVIVAGWSDEDGYVHAFPAQQAGRNAAAPLPLPVRDAR